MPASRAAQRVYVDNLDDAPLLVRSVDAQGNPIEETIYTYTHLTGTAAASGDNQLVAAPAAGSRLVIKDLIVQNESAAETTVILRSGATAIWRAKLAARESLVLGFAAGEEWRLGAAEALILNLSGANSHGFSVRYRTETV